MLSDAERREMEAELEHYERAQSVSVDALKIVQRHRGWVDDEGLADCAAFLDMPPTVLEGVATFNNLIFRRPVGRHVILLCDSISCWVCNHERGLAHLRATLGVEPGQTTADGRFTLLPVNCLGACDGAPVMMIDDDLHRDLTPERIDEVLARYD